MLLEQIQQTNDIKKIDPKDYPLLAEEIRKVPTWAPWN